MDIDELESPKSWISVQALRNAADPRASLKSTIQLRSSSSPPETPRQSFIQKRDSKFISTQSLSTHLHTRYNTLSIDSFQPYTHPDPEPAPQHKYISIISRLNEEITILSTQLNQSNLLIAQLNKKLNEISNKHALHIQALQERHEAKVKKIKFDLEMFMKEVYCRNSAERAGKDEQKKRVGSIKERCVRAVERLKDKLLEEIAVVEREVKKKNGGRVERVNYTVEDVGDDQEEAEEEESMMRDVKRSSDGFVWNKLLRKNIGFENIYNC